MAKGKERRGGHYDVRGRGELLSKNRRKYLCEGTCGRPKERDEASA